MPSLLSPGLDPAARGYLLERKTRGVVLGLERMQAYLAAIGDPHLRLPCVHVAGTNGKGSVAAMLEAILRAAGWRVGLYTSPHLVKLGERIQVDRQSLTEPELAGYVEELRPLVTAIEQKGGPTAGPSYFEFMTGLAFHHFVRRRCDIAVIETGVGGRRDATNVVTPEVSVITSVGLDHCELLGQTLVAIAGEKAGIIKPGRPVVIGRLPPEAEAVVRRTAERNRAPISSVRAVFERGHAWPRTNLPGEYQRWNAATATLAARSLDRRWRINDGRIEAALQQVQWIGRWQSLPLGGRTLVIDSSHNPEGAQTLEENLRRQIADDGRAPVAITGVLGRARAAAILPVLCRHAREIHLVVPQQGRACSHEELEACLPTSYAGRVVRSEVSRLFPAAGECAAGGPGDTVVVTGSIYLAGEVLARLEPQRGSCDSDLQDF